jgi:hypothetical protein
MEATVSNYYTEVKGIGRIPAYFYAEFDGVNLEEYSNSINDHNENNFYAACNRDDWVNDEFNISGAAYGDGYMLTVYMNSDASLPLYNNGYATFSYDTKTQKWSSLTGTAEGHLWRFCSSSEVVKTVIAGLKCYNSDINATEGVWQAIELLIPSLEESSETLTASTAIYAGEGCDVVQESFMNNLTNAMAASPVEWTASSACDR